MIDHNDERAPRPNVKFGETDEYGDPLPRSFLDGAGILTVPVKGVLDKDVNGYWETYGFTPVDRIAQTIRNAVDDPSVRGILLDINSPGGSVVGTHEAAKVIQGARKKKPIYASTEYLEASGAYYIAAGATRKFATTTAYVGSIGVWMAVLNLEGYFAKWGVKIDVIRNTEGVFKAAGAFGQALTERQREEFQRQVDVTFSRFKAHVEHNRTGISKEIMRGQVVDGEEAVTSGLVDALGGRETAYQQLLKAVRG